MKDLIWYDVFLANMHDKYPKKTQLVDELVKLLCIEKEAVYRRLRKDVHFLAHEIVTIASTWNISLDAIFGVNSGLIPFQLQPINYLEPTKKEMFNFQQKIRALEHFKTAAESEYMEVCNKFPRPLITTPAFKNLHRFKIFNWAFLYNNEEPYMRYSDAVIPAKVSHEFEIYNKLIKKVSNTNLILDQKVFEYIVNNIQYYHSIMLVTDEEKALIKKELYSFLDYLMKIANYGCYPETQKKVNIFISNLKITTNYSYYYTEQLKSCRIHAFGKFDICSYESKMVNNFKNWMDLKKRSSIQISEVNEKSRIDFFMQQRQIVDSL